jgi:glycosyltransferase involved in cell wall biosynthesis
MTAASRNSTNGRGKPLRVTLVGTLPPNMGIADYTGHLVRGLAGLPDLSLDVIDFSSLYPRRLYPGRQVKDATAAPLQLPNVPVRRLLAWYNPLSWVWAGLSARGDVVHAQWWSYVLAPIYAVVLSLARLRRKRIVLTVHNALPHEGGLPRRLLNRTVLGLADGYVVHDAKSQALLRRQVGGRKEIAVIPHGILEAAGAPMARDEARRALDLPASAAVALHFGNIRPYKGLDVLIEAFANVRREVPEALLLIAGNPWEDWSRYQTMIDELGISSAVRAHLEFVPSERVRTFFSAADVVVLPYLHFDAQSGVGARALYHGKALIVTDVGGLPELVEDERAVVPAGDPRQLARALAAVLADPALRQRLEQQSSKRAGELQWDAIAQRTAGFYVAMLGGCSEAARSSVEDAPVAAAGGKRRGR